MRKTKVLTAIVIAVAMLALSLPAMASEIVLKKNTIPEIQNVYELGDTIHYLLEVQNPSGNIATNTVTVTDTYPDGTVETLATDLVQVPGDLDSWERSYVVDINDVVWDDDDQVYKVINRLTAVGEDSLTDDINAYVEKHSIVDLSPSILLKKYVNGDDAESATGPIVQVGSTVTFRYVVTNTGNVPLESVVLTDSVLGPITSWPYLAPGDTVEISVTAPATAGQYHNTGTVEGVPDVGEFSIPPVSDTDEGHYFGALVDIDIEKYVSVDGGTTWLDADTAPGPDAAVPGSVKFKVVVENTGNVTLTGIDVEDTDFGFTGVATSLAPGASDESDVITVPAVVGQHENLADVIGYAGAVSATDEDYAHYWGVPRPSIDLEKYVSVDGGATWQDADTPTGPNATVPGTVKFKVVVTNTGNVPLSSISVNDSDFTFTGVATSLAPGASDESDVLTVASVVGQHENEASVIGWYDEDSVGDKDLAHYWGVPRPAIDIEKLVSVDGGATWLDADTAPGPNADVPGTVKFKVIVTNTGNMPLNDVSVDDTDFIFAGVAGSLAVGASDESDVLTVPSVVGQHYNLATVEGYYDEAPPVTDEDPAHYYGVPELDIDIEKYVSVDGGSTWVDADTVTGPHVLVPAPVKFKVVVTNNGNVTLTGIVVHDTDFTFSGVATSLAPGASDESDVLTVPSVPGQHENLADVIGYYEAMYDTDEDYAHYFGDDPSLDLEKLVNGEDADTVTGPIVPAGSTVTFTYIVTNTGNITLLNIVVTDDKLGVIGTIPSLAPGASATLTATDTAIVGQYRNVADATDGHVSDSDPGHYFGADPHVDLEKLVNGEDADVPTGPVVWKGDTVTFTFIVENTGNVPLTNVVVTDDVLGIVGTVASLAVGDTATFTVTDAAEAGQHENLATVTTNEGVTDDDPGHYFANDPCIDIEKLINGEDADCAPGLIICGDRGCLLTFTFIVTNCGNMPLVNITVDDNVFGHIGDIQRLDPGDSETFTVEAYSECGQHSNIGTAVGHPLMEDDFRLYASQEDGRTVSDFDLAYYFGKCAEIDLEKLVNGEDADAAPGPYVDEGSVVHFDFVVTNTGNTTLTYIEVNDSVLGFIGIIEFLEPGESETLSATGIAEAGQHHNVGTAVSESCGAIDTDPGNYFGVVEAIDIEKSIMGDDADEAPGWIEWCVGCTIDYMFVVTNVGNVPLHEILVTDTKFGTLGTISELLPGHSVTYTKSALSEAGQHYNIATAEAAEGVSDSDYAYYFGALPGIDLEKLVNGQDADTAPGPVVYIGSDVTFEFVVTNTGNIALEHVVVYDDVFGNVGVIELLEVDESESLFIHDTAEAGQHTNLATAMYCEYEDSDFGNYFGEERPPVDEGMSVSWWRTHKSEWEGYSTSEMVCDVFDIPTELDSLCVKDLFDVLAGKIKMTEDSAAANNLLKEAIAALLNAAHPDINYPMFEGEIISQVNAALASLDEGDMEDLADILHGYNSLGMED